MTVDEDKGIVIDVDGPDFQLPRPKTRDGRLFFRIAQLWKDKAFEIAIAYRELTARLKQKEVELERLKTDRRLEHQEKISQESEVEDYANEVDGLIRRDANVKKRVTAELLMEKAAHKDIDDAIGDRQPRTWIRMTWEVVILASLVLLTVLIAYNAPFRMWVSQNILGVLGICAVAGFMVYAIYSNKKRK